MFSECKELPNWYSYLGCKLLSTPLCPLEEEDALEKIAHRIKIMVGHDHLPIQDTRKEMNGAAPDLRLVKNIHFNNSKETHFIYLSRFTKFSH